MGVPVMTIRGDRHSARVSATILESVSLGDFVANDYKDFVSKASYIASRLDYLEDLRRTLRRRVDESSLTDGKNFSRKLEAIFTSLIKTSEYRE
jgi:predicted O-linked N-acetylglucosamine transferase (SPINDLY family)